jgi:sulfur-carrier protein adenylyltransferase/sulfurtransferase
VLDVRSESEFKAGHVPGAVNIPVARLLSDPRAITGTGGDELILYCGLGPRAHVAGTALQYRGRKRIIYMSGHWAAWQAAGLRMER